MVGSNGTMIAIRLVRSKLRKREEHSNSVHPTDVVLQTAPSSTPIQTTTTTNAQPNAPQALQADPLAYRGQFLWQYPPPPQPQYLYNNDQVECVVKIKKKNVGKERRNNAFFSKLRYENEAVNFTSFHPF